MKKEAIYHMPLSEYAYAENEHAIRVRIRTAKNDIQSCKVYFGNRYNPHNPIDVKEVEMEKMATDDLFDYYEATLEDEYTRVCYYFYLDDGTEGFYYHGRGFTEEIIDNRTEFFQFPYIRREDILSIPEWAKEAVIYHIFPDSFATEKKAISNRKIETTITEGVASKSMRGGTIRGIMENIDYLVDLGINCIYLNPIFAAHSYHKYDTTDYFDIDPCFGTKEEFIEMVKECHQLGIRVILDGVFNHCGADFFAFRDVLEKGGESKYHSWFYHMPLPVEFKNPPNYEAFAYVKEMPKMNTGNPEVIEYFCKVGTYWIETADIDGWRLDVANEIDHEFWRSFRRAVRSVKKDCFLIGEIWEDAQAWLRGEQFDSSMNYPFTNLCKDLFATKRISLTKFDEEVNKMYMRYPWPVNLCQMNFLDTHDVSRFLSLCGGKREKLKLAFAFMMTSVGTPSIFYGDELEIEGIDEKDYRREMPWDSMEDHKEMYDFFRKWISIRKENDAIKKGMFRTVLVEEEKKMYAFERWTKEQKLCIVFNMNDKEQTAELPDGKKVEMKPQSVELMQM